MKRADESVLGLIGSLPLSDRNAAGRSYYGSLHQLASHVLGGTLYFMSLFRPALNAYAAVFARREGCRAPTDVPDEAAFDRLRADAAAVDDAVIRLVQALKPAEYETPVAVDWYKDPPAVPFHFLFNQLIVHGIHHRGQISQILDELKVEHDFSGIDLEFLSH